MKTLITGATGFVGRRLIFELASRNHDLVVLTRDPARAKEKVSIPCQFFQWDPMHGPPPEAAFEGVDAVVHLAGENLADKPWTEDQKKRIRDSRVFGTKNLVQTLAKRKGKPLIVVSASAVGYYGDRGEEELHEQSNPGTGFLADVCRDWEAAIRALPYGHARVVIPRFGVVLGADGGLLKRLIPIFRAGAGAPLGNGKQWMSWIHIQDLVSLILWALENPALEGAMNAVAPHPVRNEEFSAALAKALARGVHMRAPAKAVKTVFGDMSEMLLASQKVVPDKPLAARFTYQFAKIEDALSDLVLDPEGNDEYWDETWIPEPIEKVFAFFADGKNLDRLTPPWMGFQWVDAPKNGMEAGSEMEFKFKVSGIPFRWRSRIESFEKNRGFVDVQVKGPYRLWRHSHRFAAVKGGTLVRDRVAYSIPGGLIGKGLMGGKVKRDLEALFKFRREELKKIFSPKDA